jgi:hypothetical protein
VYAFKMHPCKIVMLAAAILFANVTAFLPPLLHSSCMYGKRFAMHGAFGHQRHQLIESRTLTWLKQWVIGLKLCPWAPSVTQHEGLKLVVVNGSSELMSDHVMKLLEEGNALASKWNQLNGSAFQTTLLVFPDDSYLGDDDSRPCGDFPASFRSHCATQWIS